MKITDILPAAKAAHLWFDCGCQVNAVFFEPDDLSLHWTTYKASGAHHYRHECAEAREEIKQALKRGEPCPAA